ncbi:hypothetical protein BS330_27490 [Amycolatopsis keratiniphila subsp. nogabecina]|nr:hypothetical protein BS330_27490 [Amycolatopsis keratiniphila subsp. nogabecina]
MLAWFVISSSLAEIKRKRACSAIKSTMFFSRWTMQCMLQQLAHQTEVDEWGRVVRCVVALLQG